MQKMFPHEIELKFLYQQVKQTYKIEKRSSTFVQIFKPTNSKFFLTCALLIQEKLSQSGMVEPGSPRFWHVHKSTLSQPEEQIMPFQLLLALPPRFTDFPPSLHIFPPEFQKK